MTKNKTPADPLRDVVTALSRWMHPLLHAADDLDAAALETQNAAGGDPRRYARADRMRGSAHRLRQWCGDVREVVEVVEQLAKKEPR